MKTMKQNLAIIAIIVVAAVMALPAAAQQFNTFGGTMAPQASFQSTSTMRGTGSSYSSNPMINRNGTAVYNGAAASYGPHRAKKDGDPFTEDDDINQTTQNPQQPGTPLGDALVPLALMALAFGAVVAVRRRRSAEKN